MIAAMHTAVPSKAGKLVVAGMIGAGLLAALVIFLYWRARLGPYVPLIRGLAKAFPKSAPRVEGGDLPNERGILRVILKVDFTPEETDPRVDQILRTTLTLAHNLGLAGTYQTLDLYLVRYVPERAAQRLRLTRPLAAGPGKSAP
jgi:hypothetical protein